MRRFTIQRKRSISHIRLSSPQNLEFFDIPVLDDVPALTRVSEIQVPLLNIIGEGDIADNHAVSGIIKAALPNSERQIVSNAGHLVYLEQSGIFNLLVDEWFQQNNLIH